MAAYAAASVAVSGELYGRKDWLRFGTGPSLVFVRWMQSNVPVGSDDTIDGFWDEQTTLYHFYALAPMITLYELTGTLTEENETRFRKMFEAPLHLADKGLNHHVMGDLASPENFSLIDMRMFYEYAAGRISETDYAPVLSTLYQRGGIERGGLWSLIFGPDQLTSSANGLPISSSSLPISGFATFRDIARSIELGFRSGSFRGGHDHPDRLSVFISADGQAISPDLGEPGYGLRSQTGDYYRRTISHNTLFSNESDNQGGASMEWLPESVPQRARGVVDNSHGVRYERIVFYDPPVYHTF